VDAGKNALSRLRRMSATCWKQRMRYGAKLTPAQRAIEPQTVTDDASLWPAKVICMSAFTLNSGKDIHRVMNSS